MGYLTKMNGKYGQNGFSAVGFSILGQPPSKRGLYLFLYIAVLRYHSKGHIIKVIQTTWTIACRGIT